MNWADCDPSLQNCEKKRFILTSQLIFRSLFVARDRKIILRVPLLFSSSKWFWSDPYKCRRFRDCLDALGSYPHKFARNYYSLGTVLLEFACPEVLPRDCNVEMKELKDPVLEFCQKQSDLLSRTILICCFVVFAICLTAHLPGVVVVWLLLPWSQRTCLVPWEWLLLLS